MKKRYLLSARWMIVLSVVVLTSLATAADVYLVLGSDTAIWQGMWTSRYNNFYDADLYKNPSRNAYEVMDPSVRSQWVDSYGQTMKLTWWMMGGNIFRFATNTDVPVPNHMPLHLMRTLHGDHVKALGDELSLHYHTFHWFDYNGDGQYFWNQALRFEDCRQDWEISLAQMLIEEKTFPVSFRSGWHYMDNDWQAELDDILPFSMHNAWPANRTDTTEPLDNTYHWHQSPEDWIAFHPSTKNYQVPGDGPGWNVRSTHIGSYIVEGELDEMFGKASQGEKQIACLWGHLPETDFVDNLARVDSLAHLVSDRYPDVNFRYCTAIEGMQYWMESSDTTAPQFDYQLSGSDQRLTLRLTTDEAIFQPAPVVAVRDVYNQYRLVSGRPMSGHQWTYTIPMSRDELGTIGITCCDPSGNQAMEIIHNKPADQYLDNLDLGYSEILGTWSSIQENIWYTDARRTMVSPEDSAAIEFSMTVDGDGYRAFFTRAPWPETGAVDTVRAVIQSTSGPMDTTCFDPSLIRDSWVFIGSGEVSDQQSVTVRLSSVNTGDSPVVMMADVVKVTAMVPERDLSVASSVIDLKEVSRDDTVAVDVTVENRGKDELTISRISSALGLLTCDQMPLTLESMSKTTLSIWFSSPTTGGIQDTLYLHSDDPVEPRLPVLITADVERPFVIIDNEDEDHYRESGKWAYSVARAHGPTSRYAYIGQNPRAYARFSTTLKESGVYELYEIVPETVNATSNALYIIRVGDTALDTVLIDQNEGSGNWVSMGRFSLPAGEPVVVEVRETGQSTRGPVLRADAIKWSMLRTLTDVSMEGHPDEFSFHLSPNYPNPFNSVTTIDYEIAQAGPVQVTLYNALGKKVRVLQNAWHQPGRYSVQWDGRNGLGREVSSGVYFYHLSSGNRIQSRKLLLIK
jgi:hypothetical protein